MFEIAGTLNAPWIVITTDGIFSELEVEAGFQLISVDQARQEALAETLPYEDDVAP